MGDQIRQPRRNPVVAKAKENHHRPNDNHHQNGNNFNHGKPKLKLPKGGHRHHIDNGHSHQGQHGRNPLRHVGKPKLHIHPYRRNLRHTGHYPHKPIGPSGNIACQRTDKLVGIGAKRAADRIGYRQLPQGAHNKQNKDAANDVR